ncbi:MAG: hypothetical protein KDA61_09620 [Planctomycetales bacterium]|nr:hypothetical protein [Planctomycetales bacterium]
MHCQRLRNRIGMSLLEVTLVVLIIAVLAAVLVPRIKSPTDMARENSCFHNKAHINSALERYFMTNEAYPAALSDLVDEGYMPSGVPVCPVTGAAYTTDATSHLISGHTSGSH